MAYQMVNTQISIEKVSWVGSSMLPQISIIKAMNETVLEKNLSIMYIKYTLDNRQ
jgi:hypothetical protein